VRPQGGFFHAQKGVGAGAQHPKESAARINLDFARRHARSIATAGRIIRNEPHGDVNSRSRQNHAEDTD
jgi:hypothetical protein